MAQLTNRQLATLESLLITLQGLVASLKGQLNVPPEIRQRIEKFQAEKLCLYCGDPIKDEKVTRGCHADCYAVVNSRINRGKLTEQEAVNKGWWNPEADSPGRKRRRRDPMRERPSPAQVASVEADAEALYARGKAKRKAKRP